MSDNGDRKNPQLPQYATPSEQRKRAREVGSARETYTWTTQVETLPGVPLAAKVPFADEPSIPWLLAAVKVALPVAENAIAVKRAEDGTAAAAAAHTETVERIRASRAALADHHDGPSEGSSALGDLVSAAMGGIGSFLGTHASTLNSHVDDLKAILDANRLGPKAAADLAAFEQLFQKLPLPEVAETFGLDSTFARMRVAGPNAGLLQGIKALPSNFPLSDEQYRAAMRYGDGDKDSLAQAGAEKRLYIVDYAALSSMVPGTSGGRQKYLWCPLALFAVPVGGRSLQPVAIQGGQDPAAHRMFLRPPSDDKRDWGWEMSKFIVQVADGNYHELFAHLARTHLVVEAFAVANHRALAPSHPLHLLLLAHTQGTLFINNSAAGGLIASGGPIEQIFAGTIETIQLAAAHDRLAFDFSARMLPRDLESRGVMNLDGLPDYPYRDDALLVWGALRRWVEAYVRTYYSDDGDVVGDTELAAFCAEVRGAGKVKGFPVIEKIDTLVDALTMILFTGSAQHAAVNFPQQTDMTWVPNVTGSAWAPGPDQGGAQTEAGWFAMMPSVDLALEQLNTLWVLGGVHFRKLGDYLEPSFPYHAWFLDPKITRDGGPLEAFRNDLREVQAQIEKNNAAREVPYPFLQPGLIPESINI
jgi:arachidonate 15-lipoxygenase